MQLRHLSVSNIRSFVSGDLDLGPGTTLLVGDVGAGKSSLLYAVEMALFGVAEVDAAFLVRHGTSRSEVEVTLEDREHTYAVRRRFRKVRRRGRETYEPERLTYAEDGRPTSYSATEIRQRVIDLLGFPDNPNPHAHSDLWRWAIYVPQERMREILAADPEERLETVRKALGVERYRTAAENAQLLAADLRSSARHRRESAERLAHWDTEFADATREGDRIRSERTTLAATVESAAHDLAAARQRRQDAERAANRAEAERRELDGLRQEESADASRYDLIDRRRSVLREELASALTEAERLRPVVAVLSDARTELTRAEEELRQRRAELDRHGDALRELASATAARDAAQRRCDDTASRVAEARRELESAREQAGSLAAQSPLHEPPSPTPRSVSELEVALRSAVSVEHAAVEAAARARARSDQLQELLAAGVCPTCAQPVRPAEFEVHRAEALQALRQAESDRARHAEERLRLEEALKARERYDRAFERWTELERRREDARTLVTRRVASLASAEDAAAAAQGEAEGARRRLLSRAPAQAENDRLRERVAGAEPAVQRALGRVQEGLAAQERHRALVAVGERGRSDLARLAEDLDEVVRRRTQRADRIAELEPALRTADRAAPEVERARQEEALCERRATEARAALVRSDTRLDAVVERVAMAERGRAERAGLVAEATDLDAKAAWVGEPLRLAFLRMEKELLAHAQSTFDRAFARFFASLIDDPSLTARTDVTFTPEVMIAGQPTPAEALSGGERTALALAFRLALATVVRRMGTVRLETLLLDEPTDGFSAEQVVRMGDLLEELALPQVLLVSHESELAGVADRTVRVTKVGGCSVLRSDVGRGEARVDPDDRAAAGAPSPEPASPDTN